MSKMRIYIKPEKIENFLEVSDQSVIHKIRNVLRLKPKQEIFVFDGQGKEYVYVIKDISKKCILLKKEKELKRRCFLSRGVTLAFPVVKEEKVNFILQKATELGVRGFIPFVCERSLRGKLAKQKLERWKKIINGAAGQSGRLWMPDISEILDFKEVLRSNYKTKLAASVKGERLSSILDDKKEDILVLIGPEGGFSPLEYSQLEGDNFKFLKLSSHILRVETASIFSVGLINYTINNHTREA